MADKHYQGCIKYIYEVNYLSCRSSNFNKAKDIQKAR